MEREPLGLGNHGHLRAVLKGEHRDSLCYHLQRDWWLAHDGQREQQSVSRPRQNEIASRVAVREVCSGNNVVPHRGSSSNSCKRVASVAGKAW
jgi:hypothetical protein